MFLSALSGLCGCKITQTIFVCSQKCKRDWLIWGEIEGGRFPILFVKTMGQNTTISTVTAIYSFWFTYNLNLPPFLNFSLRPVQQLNSIYTHKIVFLFHFLWNHGIPSILGCQLPDVFSSGRLSLSLLLLLLFPLSADALTMFFLNWTSNYIRLFPHMCVAIFTFVKYGQVVLLTITFWNWWGRLIIDVYYINTNFWCTYQIFIFKKCFFLAHSVVSVDGRSIKEP